MMPTARCLLVFVLTLWASSAPAQDRDTIFQYSTLDALKAGLFDGEMTHGELARHGDFGVGTFNALDGEMVGFDGQFWRITADGAVSRVGPEVETPFAVVTFFEPDVTLTLPRGSDYAAASAFLSAHLAGANTPVAVMIRGTFTSLRIRAAQKQEQPYTTLGQALDDQAVWNIAETSGTMAGFWFPQWLGNINAAAWHLHYLSDDRSVGGHVLEMMSGSGTVGLDTSAEITLVLPESRAFDEADLSTK